MKKMLFSLLIMTLLFSAGCSKKVQKDWTATGGSRSDGMVRLTIQHNAFEIPEVNDLQGVKIATERCERWGYTGAEAFGGSLQVCNGVMDAWGNCSSFLITKEYQCTGHVSEINKNN